MGHEPPRRSLAAVTGVHPIPAAPGRALAAAEKQRAFRCAKLPGPLDLFGSLQKPRSHNRLLSVVGLSGDLSEPAENKARGAVGVAN
jgi:hypothetical protein